MYAKPALCTKGYSIIFISVFCRCAVTVAFWGRRLRRTAYLVTTTCPWATSVVWCPGRAAWMEPQTTRQHPQQKLKVGDVGEMLTFLISGLVASKHVTSSMVKGEKKEQKEQPTAQKFLQILQHN